MAKPNKKGPTRTVDVFCRECKTLLYKYRKGGKGTLVKCFKERIVTDYTDRVCHCPHCQQLFAREVMIRGVGAYKIIGGKVFIK
ncbi:hypothetical protein Q4493_14875 [Colwellia sp. 1_MG-2023]|uniref:hypothetical protein n=1 Tax=Colwellia sp. 1_MG-2023 TaxID=3062649 RepID=UPI0026E1D38F|nr:hypothetical protein [Colwellia sp. 1_MG-2023]MDO6447052.1 hypothetical protein [Colwellia sp. 1_MG-2023]